MPYPIPTPTLHTQVAVVITIIKQPQVLIEIIFPFYLNVLFKKIVLISQRM